jgi:PTS system mannose-specific IIA component
MIGLLLATHGGFAAGILSAVELLMGEQESVEIVSLVEGESPDTLADELTAKIGELDSGEEGEGVLILTDLLGGTPFNCIAQIMHKSGSDRVRCLTGLNLPMLVEALNMRDENSLAELEDDCLNTARTGIQSVTGMLG